MTELDLEEIQRLIDESGEIDVLGLPGYVRDPLKRQGIENLERVIYLCLQLIEERRLEEKAEPEEIPEEVEEALEETGGGPVQQQEKVKCGKENCNTCPHGPYIYEYERVPGERVVSRYIGKPG